MTTSLIKFRVTAQTKHDAQQYADAHSMSLNAALNVLTREGLQAVEMRELQIAALRERVSGSGER